MERHFSRMRFLSLLDESSKWKVRLRAWMVLLRPPVLTRCLPLGILFPALVYLLGFLILCLLYFLIFFFLYGFFSLKIKIEVGISERMWQCLQEDRRRPPWLCLTVSGPLGRFLVSAMPEARASATSVWDSRLCSWPPHGLFPQKWESTLHRVTVNIHVLGVPSTIHST